MAQTPCKKVQAGDLIPDPSTTTRTVGDVVLLGSIAVIVAACDPNLTGKNTLDVSAVYDVPKDTSVFAAGDQIYWNPTGSPVTGTASSGCATSNPSGAYPLGFATVAALTGDSYVRTRQMAVQRPVTMPRFPTATVAATGSVQGDAAAIGEGFTLVTGADATKGALLPSAVAGMCCIVKNSDAANAVLKIWPASGDAVNALSANAAFSIAAKTSVVLIALDATTWYSTPLLPS